MLVARSREQRLLLEVHVKAVQLALCEHVVLVLGEDFEAVVQWKDSRTNRVLLPLQPVCLLSTRTVSVSGLLRIVSPAPRTGLRKVAIFYLGQSHKLPYK